MYVCMYVCMCIHTYLNKLAWQHQAKLSKVSWQLTRAHTYIKGESLVFISQVNFNLHLM